MVLCRFRAVKRITSQGFTRFTRFGAFEHSSVYTLGDQNLFVQTLLHSYRMCFKKLSLTLILLLKVPLRVDVAFYNT